MIRTYEERWQRLSCLLLEGNDKGHDSRLPVHKLVTKKVVVRWELVGQKAMSSIGSKADSDLIERTKS